MAVVALLRIISPVEITEGGLQSKVSSLKRKKSRWSLYSHYTGFGLVPENKNSNNVSCPIRSSLVMNPAGGEAATSSEQKVYHVVLKQAALIEDQKRRRSAASLDVKADKVVPGTLCLLKEAYDRCGEVCAEYAKTFYLG